MRKTRVAGLAVTAAAVALATGSAVAGPAFANHDTSPSAKVASYSYGLNPVQQASVPNSQASGSTRIKTLPGGKMQVNVEAHGLAPNLPHAMHLHDTTGANRALSQCPTPAADTDGNGVITVAEGAPFYGGILVSLTVTGDTSPSSALALDRFPVADAGGNLSYSRVFTPSATAYAQAGTEQVVVHGIDFDNNGTYAFNPNNYFSAMPSSLNPSIPLEATVPVLCGGILN